jgi:hypothetical protein
METVLGYPTLNDVRYARPVDRFIIGLDLGKSVDCTAIAVLHHTITPLDKYTNYLKIGISKQHTDQRFNVVHLERLPLGMPYPAQIHHVEELVNRDPLRGRAPLVMDDSGVGRPIGDSFVEARLRPKRITITSGLEVTQHDGDTWHVPKSVLISTMEGRIHTGELKVAKGLLEAGPLKEELLDFERHVSESGRTTWGARVGKHDDIVLAVSLAVWWAVRTSKPSVTSMPLEEFFATLNSDNYVQEQYVGPASGFASAGAKRKPK